MKTPRVQSLLAALVLLTASRVAASAAAAAEPENIRWRPVVFHSSDGKNAMPCSVAYCKESHCAKAPVGPTHVPLYCRGKNGAMENSSYVMTLTPSGSRFSLTSNKEKSGPTGISVKFGDRWATAPDPDKPPRHGEASKPQRKPGGGKPVAPGKEPVVDPVVAADGLLPSELLWLTFLERDDSKPTNAAKRDQVAANLRPTEKDGYTAKLKIALKDAAAYLDGLKPYSGAEIALSADEQKLLAPAKLGEYNDRMSLEVRKEGATSDLVMANRITEEFRKLLPKKEPGAKPADDAGAVQDLKPLTTDELKNLTEAERIAYESRLKQAQTKLEEAKKKKDPAGIAAANEELSALITEYRKKAAANTLTTIPTNVDELNACTKPQQNKFCTDLLKTPDGSFVAGYTVVKEAAVQAEKAQENASGIFSGQTDKGAPAVSAAPQPQIAKTEVDKLRDRCKELMAALPASGTQVNLTVKKDPGLDTDGKAGKKEDKDAMLDVKAGAIGAVGGAFLGMLGGPVGIIIGAIIGFVVFYAANKALR